MSRFSLRKRQTINYHEPEEPNLDEYIFCDSCGDYVYEYCSIHGPLLVIPDNQVPTKPNFPPSAPRAALTIPHLFLYLAPSSIPGAGLGVFASRTLPRGVRFGPYRGRITKAAESSYCWQIYDSKNRSSHVVDGGNAELSNWMRYVNCSRHFIEQNLLAFQNHGDLYYRTIKIIPRFTELMVFYGSEFASSLSINLKLYNSSIEYSQLDTQIIEEKIFSSESSLDKPVLIRSIEDNPESASQIIKENETSSKNLTHFPKYENTCIRAETIVICNECYQQFYSKNDLIEHLKAHRRNFVCNLCNFNSENLDIFTKHLYARHKGIDSDSSQVTLSNNGKQKHICLICKMEFKKQYELKKHLYRHTGEKHFACPNCQLTFTKYKNMRRHLFNIHTLNKENTVSCAICNKKFFSEEKLKSHMRYSHAERNLLCSLCIMTFRTTTGLKRHLESHAREKIIICQYCPKRFVNRNNFELHLLHYHYNEGND